VQLLEAAPACPQEHGLEAASMEVIIARSGLSIGAADGECRYRLSLSTQRLIAEVGGRSRFRHVRFSSVRSNPDDGQPLVCSINWRLCMFPTVSQPCFVWGPAICS
jgi:hypothetical protein